MLCQIRKVSTTADFELQVRRLDEMGKIIDTLTTMLTTCTRPSQPQGSVNEKTRGDECALPLQQKTLESHDETVEVAAGVSLRGKHDQFTVRKVASALRLILRQTNLEKSCSQTQVKKSLEETTEGEGFGSLRANHEQCTQDL